MAKVNLYPDFREFLELLNSAKVKYLLLGGYAVIHYGYRRMTDDLDVWIAVDSRNATKVSKVLQEYAGYSPSEVQPSMFRKKGKIFIFGREPIRIDLLTNPSGLDFNDCYERRQVVDWDGLSVPLISFDDLRKNKAASGREKDLADLKNLPTERPKKRRSK